jgi:5-methyltetrahydropteroyltriglutamate--homocysteine methyltransferase
MGAAARRGAQSRAARDPTEKIRYHTCYGINMGPRVHDMELKDIIDIICRSAPAPIRSRPRTRATSTNGRCGRTPRLPDGTILIPGVITHSTVLVEHPELVAQRLVKYAEVVGRENVIAGTDCGFATFAGADEIHPSIVWAKFDSLVQGAKIASRELWK